MEPHNYAINADLVHQDVTNETAASRNARISVTSSIVSRISSDAA